MKATLIALAALLSTCGFADAAAGRPDLVEKVKRGELKEARASWWGFDQTDSTKNLQAAIDSRVPRLVIDKMEGPWITTTLSGVSNQELEFEKGVTLLGKRGCFLGLGDCLMRFSGCENVKLRGYGAKLKMWHEDYMKPPYQKSEWRHGLSLLSCRNVLVEGLRIESSGGDGIYLGSCRKPRCKNLDVVIRDVVCDDNHRQGISVISAENLLIENTVLSNTYGTPPAAGIDFEPNRPEEFLKNCVMRNCRAVNNQGAGFFTYAGQLSLDSEPIGITFENCTAVGNRTSFGFSADSRHGRPVGGVVTLRNCRFENPQVKAVAINETRFGNLRFDIKDCVIATTNAAGGGGTPPLPGGSRSVATASSTVITPMDAAWQKKNLPLQSDADFSLPRTAKPDFAKAEIVDSAPGKLSKLQPMRIRNDAEYIVYADSARTLHFTGHQVRVGHYQPSTKPIVVTAVSSREGRALPSVALAKEGPARPPADGSSAIEKILAKLPMPRYEDAPFEFQAPAAGFYRLKIDAGSGSWVMTGCDAPIAVEVTGRAQNFIACRGSMWFEVPKGTEQLIFFARGEGIEMVHAKLLSPAGKCEWERDNVSNWEKAKFAKPAAGLWRLDSARPSQGCFEDFKYDLIGVPGHLFLNADRYWLFK